MFQLIYSSVVIFTAIWAKMFLKHTKKQLTTHHWIGIVIVTLGLMLSGLGTKVQASSTSGLGLFFAFAATMTYSCHYLLTEYVLISTNINPKKLQLLSALYDAALVTVYLVFFTIPKFDQLVAEKVEEKGGSWAV